MKIYLNSEDLGKTITYKEENGKKNYLYCKEGFEICENAQYTEQLLKENAQLKKENEAEDILNNTEPFIDKYMAIVATNFNTHIENEIVKAIHSVAVNVDEERVKQWIERAKMLDEIDKNNLIDIAIRKKFNQLKEEILELKQQQTQKAIECLKEVKQNFPDKTFAIESDNKFMFIWDYIDNKIKELEVEE